MPFNFQIDTAKLDQIMSQTPKLAEEALAVVAEEIVTDIKLSMQSSPANGAVYIRKGRTHQASAPGNPPRPDMGALIGSIRQVPDGNLKRRVTDGVEYGYYLEMTKDRPWMRPVLQDYANGKMARIIAEELQV